MHRRWRRLAGWVAIAAALLVGVGSCASDRATGSIETLDASPALALPPPATAIAESASARLRVDELRRRFVLRPAPHAAMPMQAPRVKSEPRAAFGPPVASGFEMHDGYALAMIPFEAKRGITRTARVALPMHANDPAMLEDDSSRVAVSFALRGASKAPIATTGGIAMYARALEGADVMHRVHAEGTEDFVVFESKPAREEVAYDVDVSRVAGLRLVSNTLEFLDEGGTPCLRVAPPYVVGANGARYDAKLTVGGCAYDTSGVGPWGRAITRPGAPRCSVRVAWDGMAVDYPAMLDPAWTATGSMATRDVEAVGVTP